MRLPLGYDNFKDIIDKKLDIVDKTLFIKEVLDDYVTQVAVIIRPRRFGKTLNLSMLHHFLAANVYGQSTQGLFDHLRLPLCTRSIYAIKAITRWCSSHLKMLKTTTLNIPYATCSY